MACWRVLELSEPTPGPVPQLLYKAVFGPDSYILFLTDLSNIWSEELSLDGIIHRAVQQQSPIDVSGQDSGQLAILLDNIQKSVHSHDTSVRRITRASSDDLVLLTTTSLPEPLDSLTWAFHLEKRTSGTLKNELILPLLVSSHIQRQRVNSLIAKINDKDKALTRLLDQYESSNLDLAAAFPSISASKPGRRNVGREQAARYVPGLQIFQESMWRKDTGTLVESDLSTLSLFQEALAECTSKVPLQIKSDAVDGWWAGIATALEESRSIPKHLPKKPATPTTPEPEPSDDETEDEFETHDNFKQRTMLQSLTPQREAAQPPLHTQKAPIISREHDSTDEDDEDLDAPSRAQIQKRGHIERFSPVKSQSPAPDLSSHSRSSTAIQKPTAQRFKIGGKKNKQAESPPQLEVIENEAQTPDLPSVEAETSTREPRKMPFKIGGRAKSSTSRATKNMPAESQTQEKKNHICAESEAAPSIETESQGKTPLADQPLEETAEEKADRRRRELKRKNEELARKQAQGKKKKRF